MRWLNCTVSAFSKALIHHGFVIRDAGGESAVTEVVVTGPHQSPADLVVLAHRESTAVS